MAIYCYFILGAGDQQTIGSPDSIHEAGRVVAHLQGWYEQRRPVQLDFIGLVAATCVAAGIALLIWMRRAPIPTWLALMGTILVFGYVLIRTASFHNIDRFIGESILGLRWNWVIEISGISLVFIASQWRQTSHKSVIQGG